mmetsp:Transcript_17622/g.54500  ORF Transcript_17622/g.54500 Transcript_17622/m.54500 type:complete len:261 (-) Transcript_17622:170-952(-)
MHCAVRSTSGEGISASEKPRTVASKWSRRVLLNEDAAVLPQHIEQPGDVLVLELKLAFSFQQLRPERLLVGEAHRRGRALRRALLERPELLLRLLQLRVAPLQRALRHLQRRLLAVQLVLQAQDLLLRGLLPAALVRDLAVELLPARLLRAELRLELADAALRAAALAAAPAQQLDRAERLGLRRVVGITPGGAGAFCNGTSGCGIHDDDVVCLRGHVADTAALGGLGHLQAALALAPRLAQQTITETRDRCASNIAHRC